VITDCIFFLLIINEMEEDPIQFFKQVNYQDSGGGVVQAGGGGGEGDAGGEPVDGAVGVQVGGDGGRQAEGLGDEVGGEAAVGEAAGGEAVGEVAAVGPEVAPRDGRDEVVVARVHRRVAEHDDGRHLPGGCKSSSSSAGVQQEEDQPRQIPQLE
jgi:hypothetical protein